MRLHFTLAAGLLGLGILAPSVSAQIAPTARTWTRTYGGQEAEGLYDMRVGTDGRLHLAGFTGSSGGGAWAGWLLKLSAGTGQVKRESVGGNTPQGITDGARVAADGGALFLGRNVQDIFTKHDAWAVRVDDTGDVQWSLGFTRPGFGRHFLFDAAELEDGSWVAVGATSIIDMPPQAAWVVRIAADGNVMWHSEYGGGIADTAQSVCVTADGGFALAGWTNSSGAGLDDVWVMKLDAAGDIEWQRTYGGPDQEQAQDIVPLSDGGFAIAGSTNSFTPSGHTPWVLRLDRGGGLLWSRVVGDGVWGDLSAVGETRSGAIAVVGRVGQPGFPTNDLWAAQFTSSNGSNQWQVAYEGDSGDYGAGLVAIGTGLFLGGTWGWGFPEEDAWLLRTDLEGRLPGCGIDRVTTFALSSPIAASQDGLAIRTPGGAQLQNVFPVSAVSQTEDIERCH